MHFRKANDNHSTIVFDGKTPYLKFTKLTKAGLTHGFSTRKGGVSEGIFASMNLSYKRGDQREHVDENFRRIGQAIGFAPEKLVYSDQIHHTDICCVTRDDMGHVMTGMDGLVTNISGIPLYTGYADCVPLFFFDPVKRVTGMAHSGWRGTVGKIGQVMIATMKEKYGCRPENIICAIGPSICQKCYEISSDVADEFINAFPELDQNLFLIDDHNGKFHLDLWKVNEHILLSAGILKDHLDVTDICTCCNADLLFSHRATKGKRGNLGGFVML